MLDCELNLSNLGELDIVTYFESPLEITIRFYDKEENILRLTFDIKQFKELKNKINEQLDEFI